MSTGKRGGYTKVVFGTTTGLTTSTEITGLFGGTLIGEGEVLTEQDAEGQDVSTGYRQPGEIHTTAVTAAFITNLIAKQNACTDTFFRFYTNGGGRIKVGPVRVTVRFNGAAPGSIHRYIIGFTGFDEDAVDLITIEA